MMMMMMPLYSSIPLLTCLLNHMLSVEAFAPSSLSVVHNSCHHRLHNVHRPRCVSASPPRPMANDDDDDAINTCSTNNPQPTRRQALRQSANTIFSITLATTASPPPSSAVDLPNNPLRPQYAQSTGGQYKQAKRCTAYLVDATIPPSLIPYRAQREAAILKNLGMGRGTSKTPFIEEGVNLNNFMNKAVFGGSMIMLCGAGQRPATTSTSTILSLKTTTSMDTVP